MSKEGIQMKARNLALLLWLLISAVISVIVSIETGYSFFGNLWVATLFFAMLWFLLFGIGLLLAVAWS
jgi:hypothetical protein